MNAKTVIPASMARLAQHFRTCLYCRSTPETQPPACGQRIRMEQDLGIDRALVEGKAAGEEP